MDNKAFRIVLTIKEIKLSHELKGQKPLILKTFIDGESRSFKIPLEDSIVFDTDIQSTDPKIGFTFETNNGLGFAFGELALPEEIYKIRSMLTLSGPNKDDAPLSAEVSVLIINKQVVKEQVKTSTLSSSTSGQSSIKVMRPTVHTNFSGQYSPVRSRSPNAQGQKGATSLKQIAVDKDKEKYEVYLQKLVQKHTSEVLKIVRDHKQINDVITLNKRAGLSVDPAITDMHLEAEKDIIEIKGGLTAGLLSANWDEISTPTIRQEKREVEITDEKSKQSSSTRVEYENNKPNYGINKVLNKQVIAKLLPEDNTEVSKNYERASLEQLKKLVKVLEAKSKEVDIIRQENEMMKDHTRKNQEKQHELRTSVEETTKELKIENDSNQKQIQTLIEERTTLVAKIRELNLKLEESSNAYKQLDLQKNKIENDLQDAQNESKRRIEIQSHLNVLQLRIIENGKQHSNQVNEVMRRINDAMVHAHESRKTLQETIKENQRLIQELSEVKLRLSQEKNTNMDLNHEITVLKEKIQLMNGSQELIEAQKLQHDELIGQLREAYNNSTTLNKTIDDLRAQLQSANRHQEAVEKAHAEDLASANNKNSQIEERVLELVGENALHVQMISDLKSKVSVLEEFLCLKEDLGRELDQTKQKLSKALSDRDQALENVRNLTDSHQATQDEVLRLHEIIKDFKFQLQERDGHIADSKKLLLELRAENPLYLPAKDDPTDNALADYINSLMDPSKVKILFVRESEGVYQFGSKRVYVKSEGDRILIRVGGGFISIEEFLEQNILQELNKLHCKDPMKVLQRNMQLHKTIAGRCVNQMHKPMTASYTYKGSPRRKDGPDSKC